LDGKEVAVVGQVDPRMQRAFGVRLPAYLCCVHLHDVPAYDIPQFEPPSKFPSTYRDLALVCEQDLPAQRLEAALRAATGPLCRSVKTFDEYRGPQIAPDKKSLAIRVTLQKSDTTITDAEADAAVSQAVTAVQREFGVTVRQ
jgi:phenylalanyl-tRNA synthetase beta chain